VDQDQNRQEKEAVDPLPGHDIQTHSEDGVDLTLIRAMLAMTPMERLRYFDDFMQGVGRLRRARLRS
jgi:hypothetical protein